jgi:hypothetical protein
MPEWMQALYLILAGLVVAPAAVAAIRRWRNRR